MRKWLMRVTYLKPAEVPSWATASSFNFVLSPLGPSASHIKPLHFLYPSSLFTQSAECLHFKHWFEKEISSSCHVPQTARQLLSDEFSPQLICISSVVCPVGNPEELTAVGPASPLQRRSMVWFHASSLCILHPRCVFLSSETICVVLQMRFLWAVTDSHCNKYQCIMCGVPCSTCQCFAHRAPWKTGGGWCPSQATFGIFHFLCLFIIIYTEHQRNQISPT